MVGASGARPKMGVRQDPFTIEAMVPLTFFEIIKMGPVIFALLPPDPTLYPFPIPRAQPPILCLFLSFEILFISISLCYISMEILNRRQLP